MIAVICPVRNRPALAAQCLESFVQATELVTTDFYFVADSDDSTPYPGRVLRFARGPKGMTHPTNLAAKELCSGYEHLMWVGCDHAFRTQGWDKRFLNAMGELGGWGFVYGNDQYQGANAPTACMISSVVVQALGYPAPPTLQHLYVDNAWLELGRGCGHLVYLDDVIIEHMHFIVGKSPNDAEYAEVNSPSMQAGDHARFEEYLKRELPRALGVLRSLAI